MKRREVLKVAAMGVASAGLTVAGLYVGGVVAKSGGADHVEVYQGRRILVADNGAVYIDGRQLHLMKYEDDAYLSAMCHYEFAPTPLAAARRAVEELRGADLLETAPHQHA
jgi:hypothetical protein